MPDEEPNEIRDAFTKIMFLGIGHKDRPELEMTKEGVLPSVCAADSRGHCPNARHLRFGPLRPGAGLDCPGRQPQAPRTR